jgi:hypothetical protein
VRDAPITVIPLAPAAEMLSVFPFLTVEPLEKLTVPELSRGATPARAAPGAGGALHLGRDQPCRRRNHYRIRATANRRGECSVGGCCSETGMSTVPAASDRRVMRMGSLAILGGIMPLDITIGRCTSYRARGATASWC